MASVLVYIRTEGTEATPASLEALGVGRRIANHLGGTLFGLVTAASSPRDIDSTLATVARSGADRVALCIDERFALPCTWIHHGPAIAAAAKRVDANLCLLAADAAGVDIAPRLAARLGAAYVPGPRIELRPGVVSLERHLFGRRFKQTLSAADPSHRAVATIPLGMHQPARGRDDAEVLTLDLDIDYDGVELLDSLDDPDGDLEDAAVVVSAGAGCDASVLPLINELAELLGGRTAVTRSAAAAGLAPHSRAIDLGERLVQPRLYIACAASGSPNHVGAIGEGTRIVAINRDASAPIFDIADYGVVGDVADVLASMIGDLRGRTGASP